MLKFLCEIACFYVHMYKCKIALKETYECLYLVRGQNNELSMNTIVYTFNVSQYLTCRRKNVRKAECAKECEFVFEFLYLKCVFV